MTAGEAAVQGLGGAVLCEGEAKLDVCRGVLVGESLAGNFDRPRYEIDSDELNVRTRRALALS